MLSSPPSHLPWFITGYTDEMSFTQRAWNAYLKLSAGVMMRILYAYSDAYIQRHHLPDSPPVQTLVGNLSGLLINHNSAWEYPRLKPETFVNIMGTAMDQELPDIAPDVKRFMNGAEHGVVFFALGIRS